MTRLPSAPEGPGKKPDPNVRAALIGAVATIISAMLSAAALFAVGWLQYSGPGARPVPVRTITAGTTVAAEPEQPSTSHPAGARSLLDMTPVEQSDEDAFRTGSQTVNTVRRPKTLYGGCTYASATYQLDRKYSRFQATVGLADDSSSGSEVDFIVITDEKTKASPTMKVGSTQPVSVDLTGAFRLTVSVNGSSCSPSETTAVWIDPILTSMA